MSIDVVTCVDILIGATIAVNESEVLSDADNGIFKPLLVELYADDSEWSVELLYNTPDSEIEAGSFDSGPLVVLVAFASLCLSTYS